MTPAASASHSRWWPCSADHVVNVGGRKQGEGTMTRIKLLAISTVTAVMILGSTLVFASAPAADTDTGASIDAPSISTDLQADPVRRGGGIGRNLKN
jgi:hypothetical protein